MLDLVIDFEDEGKKSGAVLTYKYSVFSYVHKMDHVKMLNDKDLMEMFTRLNVKKFIDIWVGTMMKSNTLYELVLRFMEENKERDNEGIMGWIRRVTMR